jgi:hypothetical protein
LHHLIVFGYSLQLEVIINLEKGKEVIKDNKDHIYGFVDEFLKEGIKSSCIYETDEDEDEDEDNEYWSSKHNSHKTLTISNSLHNKCMSLLYLPEKYRISKW